MAPAADKYPCICSRQIIGGYRLFIIQSETNTKQIFLPSIKRLARRKIISFPTDNTRDGENEQCLPTNAFLTKITLRKMWKMALLKPTDQDQSRPTHAI